MHRTLVEVADVAAHLDDPEWVVVDCRFSLRDTDAGRRAYRHGHIRGAVYAHLDDDLSGTVVPGVTGRHPLPEPGSAASAFGRLGIGDGVQVVSYDDVGGAVAARLWWMLHYLGHEAAAVLDGGWTTWTEEDRPTASGVESNTPRTFEPIVQQGWTVDAEEVDEARRDAAWKVLDARAGPRYRGEEEPIDPVAGHIPGALSAPFAENLDAAGRFLSRDALRERLDGLLTTTPPERVISYCGSGVTACHNILALTHAGYPRSLLYPGSWSEWITDERREIA